MLNAFLKPIRLLRNLQRPPIIYAPMPKSASNTLLQRLHRSSKSQIFSTKTCGGMGHMVIDSYNLFKANKCIISGNTPIIYQHFLPLEANRKKLLNTLNIDSPPKVIVSVRNIYDVAISCADHHRKSGGPWWVSKNEKAFLNPDKEDEHSHFWNALLCLKFFAAWAIAAKSEDWDVKFITYDDIVSRPEETVKETLDFFNMPMIPNNDIGKIRDNMNRGENGRGEKLPAYFKEMLEQFSKNYDDIDFSAVGL